MSGLHGVETIELTTGTVAVQTISTAVIGLVGTAPEASAGTQATGTSGSYLSGTALDFTAKQAGKSGNTVSITASGAAEPGTATAVVVAGGGLAITLGTGGDGVVNATLADVVAAINGLADSPVTVAYSPLVSAVEADAVVAPFTLTLSGGEDEPFPLNTPVVMAGAITQAGQLGTAGTLYDALQDIFDQTGSLVIVVRAESKDDAAEQRAAVVAAMAAFEESKTVTGYQPRILVAPGFSEDDGVAKAMETHAAKLRAVTYIDSPSMATAQEVTRRRASFGGRVELLRPRVGVMNAAGQTVFRPYSARAAGLRARIDYEKGWWWSKSNQDIYNITGVEQVDTFILGEQNCTANLLNMENVSTIIRHDGFKHWGNRLCITHSQWHFESVRRTADVIEDSIQEAMLPYVDRPLDRDVADDILGSINAYMRQLKNLGAIHGGSAWLNDELNTAETLAAGQLFIDYDFGPKSPLERLTLRVMVNNNYALEEMAA
ncbi:phage tail protein [Salmonella enterica]|uniref:phage tail sheath C-terminal domain-containing protein n=1 Tax=Salmonella enterica TaxID=28901 RepID=UPI0009AD8802|nr:phage tail sheath C-terminal domain-containing protein [Salmonella enterica]EAO4397111.1 phage tail protein [Salmonella enterica]EJA4151045.1 phage tail sheath subtilisin-like domain-containing protein [Salmonella enterica]